MTYKLLGTYKECDLQLHPFTKLFFTLSFVVAAGLVHSFAAVVVLAVILFAGGAAAKIYPPELLRVLRPFRFLLLFTFAVQLFITPMGSWQLPDYTSAQYALFFTLRMAVIIGFSSIFAFITPMMDMVRIFYVLFQPLKLFRISPMDAALSMLIALRFIPLLFTEAEKIMDSQRLKGIIPEKGEKRSIISLIRGAVSIVVPLFVRTFHYASQIAITLQYRQHNAAFLRLPQPTLRDVLFTLLFICIAAVVGWIG